MGFKTINQPTQATVSTTGEMIEAKEARITKAYEAALQLVADGKTSEAQAVLSPRHKPCLRVSRQSYARLREIGWLPHES